MAQRNKYSKLKSKTRAFFWRVLNLDPHQKYPNHIIYRLDEVFTAMFQHKQRFGHTDIQNILLREDQAFNRNPRYLEAEEFLPIFQKLKSDGFIKDKDNNLFFITIEGKLFHENVPQEFINRPYQYKEFKQKITSTWTVFKIIAAVLNAIAIILIGFLSIK